MLVHATQLVSRVVHVQDRRALGDAQGLADFPGGLAFHRPAQRFELARRQLLVAAHLAHQLGRDGRCQHGLATGRRAHGVDERVPLDALQLWVALPESRRHGAPAFEHHEILPVVDLRGGARATVVVGAFAGVASPATMYTPIAGVEVHLPAGASVSLPLDPAWEYALVGVGGEPAVQTDAEASIGSSSSVHASARALSRRSDTIWNATDADTSPAINASSSSSHNSSSIRGRSLKTCAT